MDPWSVRITQSKFQPPGPRHSENVPPYGMMVFEVVKMAKYEVKVFTGSCVYASTFNDVYIKLVGTKGESERSWLKGLFSSVNIMGSKVNTLDVHCPTSLGDLILVEIDKRPLGIFPEDDWFPAKVEVNCPEGNTYFFPIYHWIDDSEVHRFRAGKALLCYEETHSLGKYDREQELKIRAEEYCWGSFEDGLPYCIKADSTDSLPSEVQFSFTKDAEFKLTAVYGQAQLKLSQLVYCREKWTSFDDIQRIMSNATEISEYVQKHWKEDTFFGYQYLNGVNPMLIRRCRVLPDNFPVPEALDFGEGSLAEQMKKGNIYLCDYKRLDGVKARMINGEQQYLMAPLVLLFKKQDDTLVPIAIQLKQTPGEDNPIFYPSDSEYDWLLAKTFVRSADFTEHELNTHLLRTHLLAEVFAVSLLRNLPMVHPLYKLLVPYTRYTMHINLLARKLLISKEGVFTKYAASGCKETKKTILTRSLTSMTYSSLCIPDDIAERGLEDIPNFYYRDDGLQLWDIIFRFVKGVLSSYYKDDAAVQKDSELQKWIGDIFKYGFLSQASAGIPHQFDAVDDLIKFVTMVMFTCSCQHGAVNTGQYDYGAWMPNNPTSLKRHPPTTKGTTTEATLLETLPDVNTTVHGMAVMWLLSQQSSDFVPLGQYPQQRFFEETPCKLITEFQGELKILSAAIEVRNQSLDVKYTYLDPAKLENSVAI
ncbi:arachidonate 15-lipoxygenase B-like [Solea senegalensis]|uniref:Arachidonate 15-lipoxygenase B-like n=1 Tax=Solea senegalensis TaxID=28829 RepID=A0AAV6P9B0_SOLSE|nr:arachidonate 15-lipoxygenase B-like [Solea senegalensis]